MKEQTLTDIVQEEQVPKLKKESVKYLDQPPSYKQQYVPTERTGPWGNVPTKRLNSSKGWGCE